MGLKPSFFHGFLGSKGWRVYNTLNNQSEARISSQLWFHQHTWPKKKVLPTAHVTNPMPRPPKKTGKICFSTKPIKHPKWLQTDPFKFESQNASTIANVELLRLDISLWLKTSSHHRPIGAARCKKIWVLRFSQIPWKEAGWKLLKIEERPIKPKSCYSRSSCIIIISGSSSSRRRRSSSSSSNRSSSSRSSSSSSRRSSSSSNSSSSSSSTSSTSSTSSSSSSSSNIKYCIVFFSNWSPNF